MSLIQEVISFSRDYINNTHTRTPERKKKIKAAYRQLTGEVLKGSCGTCYIEALIKIKRKMEKSNCRYQLKPGAVLTAFGDVSKTCTNDNLTDELAEFHLKTNPGCAKWFSKMPDEEELAKEAEARRLVQEAKDKAQEEADLAVIAKLTEKGDKATKAEKGKLTKLLKKYPPVKS